MHMNEVLPSRRNGAFLGLRAEGFFFLALLFVHGLYFARASHSTPHNK